MVDKKDIINIAKDWIGTPYHHQESLKGRGCDCLGLLRGIWRELYGSENPEPVPNYSPSWGDHRNDDPMLQMAKKYFIEIHGEIEPGDVILFRMKKDLAVKHCAILSEKNKIIHAYSNHQVREDDLTDWWKKKIVGKFEFPGIG